MNMLFKCFRKFRKQQDGTASVEFVLLFPIFMFVMLTGFESGFYMVRNVMLERAVDVAVRDVRLGNTINAPGQPPELAALKQRICDEATVFPDCMNLLQVALRPVAIEPGGVAAIKNSLRCIDAAADDEVPQSTHYDTGTENSLMVVQVCALSKPLFPASRLGAGMVRDTEGNYALVTINSFVNEPGERQRFFEDGAGTKILY